MKDATEEQLGQRFDLLDFWQRQARGAWSGYDEREWREEARREAQRAG